MSNNELSHGIVTVNNKFMAKVCKNLKYKTVNFVPFVKFLFVYRKTLYEIKKFEHFKVVSRHFGLKFKDFCSNLQS